MEHNRQLKLTAPTEHCSLPFCIAPCSEHSVGWLLLTITWENKPKWYTCASKLQSLSISVLTKWREVDQRLWLSTSTKTLHVMHSLICRLFGNQGHPISCLERLANKTNQQISCCQTKIKEFGWRVEGRFFVKGNKNERIPEDCCDGEENVDCWELQRLLFWVTYSQRGA